VPVEQAAAKIDRIHDEPSAQTDELHPTKRPKPTVRGGFVIIGHAANSSRLTLKNDRPYEHGSREAAQTEARRLAARYGREFGVVQDVAAERPPVRDGAVS
jgi:hypothetical protein